MDKYIVSTDKAPEAIGPYSQAVGFGNLLFTSGQIALDPDTGKMLEGDTSTQMRQVMRNLESVLKAANLSFANVIKATIYLSNMSDFESVNAIYAEHFPTHPPARSTVEVSRLPKNARVEIEMIAAFPTES